MYNLKNKRVLITGSEGLLGKSHVETVINNGGQVISCDIAFKDYVLDKKNQYTFNKNKNILFYHCDITCENDINEMFSNLLNLDFLPNCLINNAANNPKFESLERNFTRFENFDTNIFINDFKVSILGSYLCSKYIYLFNIKDTSGDPINIINISSDLGIIAPDQRLYSKEEFSLTNEDLVKPVSYSVFKHGLHGLTKYLATYDPLNMRSNTLCPGGIFNNQSEEFIKRIKNRIPMQRMAAKDEYKGAINFLLSDESKYMTGSTITIDGGRCCW